MKELLRWLATNPIVANVRDAEGIEQALVAPVRSILLASGDIQSVGAYIRQFQSRGKKVFLSTDLIPGLGCDHAAVRFIARSLGPEGILTTRSKLIQAAHKEGLLTIQSLFLLDSLALKNGLASALKSRPTAIEVLPGIVPRVIRELKVVCPLPIIAGGLIRSRREVEETLAAGAVACATGAMELWWYRRPEREPPRETFAGGGRGGRIDREAQSR